MINNALLNSLKEFRATLPPCRGFQATLHHYIERFRFNTKNPLWLLMRQVCRFSWGRFLFFRVFARPYSQTAQSIHSQPSNFEDLNLEQALYLLKKDGLYLGIQLPPNVVREIYELAMQTPCYGNRKTHLGFCYSDKERAQARYGHPFVIGHYYNVSLQFPAVKQLERDPKLLELAAKYLEAEPIHQGTQLWWSFAVDATTAYEKRLAAQMFHYDLDDSRSIKFFFYLTDVDLLRGSHVCVRGSHVKKKLSHLFLRRGRSDQEIAEYYGDENIVSIPGKAGFGFVEDTYCFHKGLPCTEKDRLILTLQFAVKDYGMQNALVEPSQLKCIL